MTDKVEGLTWLEAMISIHNGNVIEYVGTANGNVPSKLKTQWEAHRGVCFARTESGLEYNSTPVYDKDFRFKETGEKVDTKIWPYICCCSCGNTDFKRKKK